jgi:hypothetical protein
MAGDKQKLKIQSGQSPAISDYLRPSPPPPTPPGEEPAPAQGYGYASDKYGTPTQPVAPLTLGDLFPNSPLLAKNQPGYGVPSDEEQAFRRAQANIGNSGYVAPPPADPVEDPFTAFLSQFAGQSSGGGAAAPDYSAYRASLTDQAQQINAQIQAMYNQLGESAGENVARLEDIYGGAQTGIGDVYESAAANTADAYGSSQQQAADQLARLGIEAAAPAVVNPMALSQAEALSGLEAGKAGGQAAAERYGATAGGFGSQMAQVAQQQGTEMNSAVLAALQNRLNETLLMEEQGRQAAASGGGGDDPMSSAMDYLRLQEMFYAPQVAQQELDFKASQIAADNTLAQEDKLVRLWSDIRNDYDSDEEAWQAAQTAISQAQSFYR